MLSKCLDLNCIFRLKLPKHVFSVTMEHVCCWFKHVLNQSHLQNDLSFQLIFLIQVWEILYVLIAVNPKF